jgi:death-on-curing protein
VTEWITRAVVLAIHDEQLAEHGGLSGVRDLNLLESALARPQHLSMFGEPPPDVCALAASYAFGIARNHPFIDGNKRTSYVVARTFLQLNGHDLTTANDVEKLDTWVALGAGELSEEQLAEWLRSKLVRL